MPRSSCLLHCFRGYPPTHLSKGACQHTFWQGISPELIGAIRTGLIFTCCVLDTAIVILRGALLPNTNFANPP